jgi:mRNA interferase MazF
MIKGRIVLIPFPITDLTGSKLRPAIVLVSTNSDITISFITTQSKWLEETDVELNPSFLNGIKKKSIIRLSKIATIDRNLVVGKIGDLEQDLIEELNNKLKTLFQL